jgi:hypothetical protein
MTAAHCGGFRAFFVPAVGATQTKEAHHDKNIAQQKERKYRVTYIITRTEHYEIDAANKKEAEDLAFSDGEFVDSGEMTSVEPFEIEEVTS